MLYEFVTLNRDEIIRRCRAKVATRLVPPPTKAEIDHGVPKFLEQLVDQLRVGATSNDEISNTALRHGHDLLQQGYSVSQVVHNYGDVCQAITELAVETRAPIAADEFRTLNRCLDDAIAGAVTEYGLARNRETRDQEAARGSERLGFFAHELRNLTQTALLAFDVLKTGNVGVGGSTGSVLGRSLTGLQALITRSLNEVRLTRGVQKREVFLVSDFINALSAAATLEADARKVALTIVPAADDASIEADRQVLAAVVGNLLQNAFKYTKPGTTVILRVIASDERVVIEIQDDCGGLHDAGGDVNDLFQPYEQRSADRTGLGLGLAYSRWGVEANHGRLLVRSLPGEGCIFAIDLPRLFVTAAAAV
jgi:signal transduction histidine kinase